MRDSVRRDGPGTSREEVARVKRDSSEFVPYAIRSSSVRHAGYMRFFPSAHAASVWGMNCLAAGILLWLAACAPLIMAAERTDFAVMRSYSAT
jgi:hypothetical protein